MSVFQGVDFVALHVDPRNLFSVLLLKAGFGKFENAFFHDNWRKVLGFSPLDEDATNHNYYEQRRFVAYYDDDPVAIDFQHDGKRLVAPQAQQKAILDRVNASTIDPSGMAANLVWTPTGRFGDSGCLIVVLVKGDTEGELYELSPTPDIPIPFVAVVVKGDHWHNVVVRAMMQVWAYLGDEYELAGDPYLIANVSGFDHRRPNVILVNSGQRAALLASVPLAQAVDVSPDGWNISKNSKLPFVAHPNGGATPDETVRKANGKVQLVEGAAGYRLNAFRSDFDCLMRRKPYSAGLPIQDAEARFCSACFEYLRAEILSNRNHSLTSSRVLLDSQHPATDKVVWKKNDKLKTAIGTQATPTLNGPLGAKWEYTYRLDADYGLKLSGIKLHDLKGILYGPVMDVFDHIGFNGLAVKFAGENARKLSFADAFANPKSPPVFEDLQNANDPMLLRGYRLSLTWAIAGRWDVEAVLSIVFRDVFNDFDPGGAVDAVKCYPQLSMRYRRPAGVAKPGKLPKVEYLKGNIELAPNNVIPPSLAATLPGHWMHMATGKQSVAVFTDSNSSRSDSQWDETRRNIAEFGADTIDALKGLFGSDPGHPPVPDFGLWTADWKSGRLLAAVDAGTVSSPSTLAAPTAHHANIFFDQPGLPHWSWLFDYVQTDISGTRTLIGCYSSKDTAASGKKANDLRESPSEWPLASSVMNLPGLKSYRPIYPDREQTPPASFFDNVHIHPDMGQDDKGRNIVAAPFCGDLCCHLHWRGGWFRSSARRRRPTSWVGAMGASIKAPTP